MKKILLAEDDRISRVMLQAVLQKWGYQVESAINGEDALAKLLDPEGPSLAILDWMMPVLDGLEVCRRVRETAGIRNIHLILLTSKSKGTDAAAALAVGADDHVAKPYDLIELQARIELGFRRIRWARDCSKAEMRGQMVQGLMEVNRLAMLQAMRGKPRSIRDAGPSPLGDIWRKVDRCMKGTLETSLPGPGGDGECEIAMDAGRLEQLVANLYEHWNAAMAAGGKVDVLWEPNGGDRLRIVCHDAGADVSDVQILSGATPEVGGSASTTGVGILFSRALAESVGGSLIWTRSLDGGGLQVEIDLPRADGSGKPAQCPESSGGRP
ncbi:MAG TPA: response regulator [Fibrobacteria bacterium]|nr:response regulator [Fibrobacteria bacterium]